MTLRRFAPCSRRSTLRRALLVVLLCGATSPGRADDAATDELLNFISNGCINAIVAGTAVGAFAAANGAAKADAKTAAGVLGKDKGIAYLKTAASGAIAIAERPGGPCTVNAKLAPSDLDATIETVEDFLGGPGGGFFPARIFEEDAGASGWTTHRVYVGQRRDRKMTLLFSTTPGAESLDQVFFAATASK